jgi:hypothetical protein
MANFLIKKILIMKKPQISEGNPRIPSFGHKKQSANSQNRKYQTRE